VVVSGGENLKRVLGGLFGFGAAAHERILRPFRRHADCITVVVGSRLVGGAGKTPFVRWLAGELIQRGVPVALCTSGYRRQGSEPECPAGVVDAAQWGDETALLRDAFPKVPFFVGRQRLKLATLCAAKYPGSVMVLDDGLQHHRLEPHVSILLQVDGVEELFLPYGEIRARKSLESEVDFLVPERDRIKEYFAKDARGIGVNPFDFAGQPVQVFTAIAHGTRVADYWRREVGADVVNAVHLRDHASLHDIDLSSILDPHLLVVTTAKDWVKIRKNSGQKKFRWVIMDYQHRMIDSVKSRFLDELMQKISAFQGVSSGS